MAPTRMVTIPTADNNDIDSAKSEQEETKPSQQDHELKSARKVNKNPKEQTVTNKSNPTKTPSTRIKVWKEPSIRHILTDYGLPDHTKTEGQKTKKEKEKKPRVTKKRQQSEDYDDEKQKSKRERYLQQYEDVQRMRTLYYKVYLEQLKEKVQAQRERIRKKSELFESKLRAQEEKEKQESHHLKRRVARHTLEDNNDFVKHVPKSSHYKIIALQDKLKSTGQLRTQEDNDKFWLEVMDPNMLQKYLTLYKPLPTESSDASSKDPGSVQTASQPDHSHPQQTSISQPESFPESNITLRKPDTEFRPMTKIQESRESSRPQTREIIASAKKQDSAFTTDRQKLDPATVAKLAAAELERKCPQMDIPEMACFMMELTDEPEDPEVTMSKLAAERRRKERHLFIKRLRRMYHLSRTNGATAQRILSLHHDNEREPILGDPSVSDLIAIDEITRDLDQAMSQIRTSSSLPKIQRPWLSHVENMRRKSIVPIQEELSSDVQSSGATYPSSRASSATMTNRRMTEERAVQFSQINHPPVSPPPLTIDGLQTKVIEPKCLSTLWTNYLRVGQSKFGDVEA